MVVSALVFIGFLLVLVSAFGEGEASGPEQEEAAVPVQRAVSSGEIASGGEAAIPQKEGRIVSPEVSSSKVFFEKGSAAASDRAVSASSTLQAGQGSDREQNVESELEGDEGERDGPEAVQDTVENDNELRNDEEFLRQLEAESEERERASQNADLRAESDSIALPEKEEGEEVQSSGVLPILDLEGRAGIAGDGTGDGREANRVR